MKNVIILPLLLAFAISVSSAQQKMTPPAAVTDAFSNQFAAGTDMRWSLKDNVYGVSFNLNQDFSIAYFTEAGELIAKGRRIDQIQLPLAVQDKLSAIRTQREQKYGVLSVHNVYEFDLAGETEYIVNLENEKISLVLVSEGAAMSVRKKTDKNDIGISRELLAKAHK